MTKRVEPGNGTQVTITVFGPDRWPVQAASLGIATNTLSPAAAGTPFTGDRGYGVNRWAGATDYPLQNFAGVAVPVVFPQHVGVGLGSGVSGQPGLPSTGGLTGLGALATMSGSPGGRPGLGG